MGYTRSELLHFDKEIPMLKSFIKTLALKLNASAKDIRNECIRKQGQDSAVTNQRVQNSSHVLSLLRVNDSMPETFHILIQ